MYLQAMLPALVLHLQVTASAHLLSEHADNFAFGTVPTTSQMMPCPNLSAAGRRLTVRAVTCAMPF